MSSEITIVAAQYRLQEWATTKWGLNYDVSIGSIITKGHYRIATP